MISSGGRTPVKVAVEQAEQESRQGMLANLSAVAMIKHRMPRVDVLVDDADRQAIGEVAAVGAAAITSRGGDLAIQMFVRPDRCWRTTDSGAAGAGSAARSRTPWRSLSIETFASASVFGVAPSTDPQADLDRLVTQPIRVGSAYRLQTADQQRGALELLDRQQPQRVPHDHRDPVPPAGLAEPSQQGREGEEPR